MIQTVSPASPANLRKVGHWAGQLILKMATQSGSSKTVLKAKQQTGPYTVQRPFYPEGDVCHLILLHPPGGLVEGDTLSLQVECHAGTHTFITTPSAGKVYQCDKHDAGQTQVFNLHENAKLEWFPQETILFHGSRSALQTDIHLQGDAQFAGWEITCLGRPIANDLFTQGKLSQRIRLLREQQPILLERFQLDSFKNTNQAKALREQAWGMGGNDVLGTLIITHSKTQHLDRARELIEQLEAEEFPCRLAVTQIDDVLICRGLAQQSRFLKDSFTQIWSVLRLDIMQTNAAIPRIWAT